MQTHTHTNSHERTHTYRLLEQKLFKKPGTHRPVAGSLVATLHRIVKLAINVVYVLLECFSETLLLCHVRSYHMRIRVWYVPYAYGIKYTYGTQQLDLSSMCWAYTVLF